jgi:hypothetical protein
MFRLNPMLYSHRKSEALFLIPALAAMLVVPSIGRPAAAAAAGPIRVLQDTPLSPAAEVPADVRKECNDLGEEMPKAMMRANRYVTLVSTPQELQEKTGRYLFVEITRVRGKAAGALTGPKKLNVRGSLVENGKEIADFEAEKGTMAAAGTCSTLEKVEKDLGASIGAWLQHPLPHSHLGD